MMDGLESGLNPNTPGGLSWLDKLKSASPAGGMQQGAPTPQARPQMGSHYRTNRAPRGAMQQGGGAMGQAPPPQAGSGTIAPLSGPSPFGAPAPAPQPSAFGSHGAAMGMQQSMTPAPSPAPAAAISPISGNSPFATQRAAAPAAQPSAWGSQGSVAGAAQSMGSAPQNPSPPLGAGGMAPQGAGTIEPLSGSSPYGEPSPNQPQHPDSGDFGGYRAGAARQQMGMGIQPRQKSYYGE